MELVESDRDVREAEVIEPGGEAVMTRLADVLVIQVLRWWLRNADVAATGWLAALRDPQVGRALGRMHARPEADWTLVELARQANMSRSAFAERFMTLVGEPPMRYLARWRLEQAHSELLRTTDAIASISSRVGYTSEAAFSRAFKRHHGTTPGAVRRSATASQPLPLTPVSLNRLSEVRMEFDGRPGLREAAATGPLSSARSGG